MTNFLKTKPSVRRICVGILALAFIGFMACVFSSPGEPRYDGKPLSFWLEQRYTIFNGIEISVQKDHADHALDTIGTNAIPTLLGWMKAQDPPFKRRLMALLEKQHLVKIRWLSEDDKQNMAVSGFAHLGSAGRDAVPELIRIYERSANAKSGRAFVRRLAVLASLIRIGPAAKDAVPMLAALPLKDSDAPLRIYAVFLLGKIHSNPEVAVPALIQYHNDPDASVRGAVARALGQFGPDAKSAIVPLKAMLKDGEGDVRIEAENALKKIEPAAMANAVTGVDNETRDKSETKR